MDIMCACNNNCTNGCHGGCSDNCYSSCSGGCDTACVSGCRGSCDGCSGGCSSSCDGCSGGCTSCSGSCSGCTGTCSSGCSTTCKGDCNNACTSSSASTTIANLGANIGQGKFIDDLDLINLKTAIEGELTRRGKAGSINRYTNAIAAANAILLEHPDKMFLDAKAVANQNYARTNIVATASDFSSVIQYIKTLMNQNIK